MWADPARKAAETQAVRGSNAEWDFMGRTFLVLSLANVGLREPSLKPRCLLTMDAIIDETLRLEKGAGKFYFMMPYGQAKPFVSREGRSMFEDGEVAVMIAARRPESAIVFKRGSARISTPKFINSICTAFGSTYFTVTSF